MKLISIPRKAAQRGILPAGTATILAGLLAMVATAVRADTVYLVSGGSVKGKVRTEGEHYIVEMADGTYTIEHENVVRIEQGDDLGTQLADKRAKLDPKDADGHYRLGLWAVQNNLPGPARDLFGTTIRIQPEHVGAELALGRVYLDGAWLDPETFQDILRQWVANGLDAAAVQVGRQALAGLMPQVNRRAVLDLTATSARRLGYFAEAVAYYRELSAMLVAGDPQYERTAASIDLLKETPGGIYLVQVDELARAVGRAAPDEPPRSGYYSLADDAVMDQALRDRAKALIAQGQALMAAAQGQLVANPAQAGAGFKQADDLFGRADAIITGIARSYRVEVRRRMVQTHQSSAESAALRFESLIKTVNPANRQDYRGKMRLGLSQLDEVQKELETILSLSGLYPQEFSAIIAWAQQDLMNVKAMRRTLEGELDVTGVPGRPGTP